MALISASIIRHCSRAAMASVFLTEDDWTSMTLGDVDSVDLRGAIFDRRTCTNNFRTFSLHFSTHIAQVHSIQFDHQVSKLGF